MTKSRLGYLLCAIVGALAIGAAIRSFHQFGSISGHTIPAQDRPSALVRSLRPNFPYSVIAGGAYSNGELSYATTQDSVVHAHYADFKTKQAKLVQLTDDSYQYASYRVKNQVYWTKKKLRIPKGELLWSDGNSYARARCGNRLSSEAKTPTRPQEPTDALSLPPIRPDMLPKLTLTEAPVLSDVPQNESSRTSAVDVPSVVKVSPEEQAWGVGPYPGSTLLVAPVGTPSFSGGGPSLVTPSGGASPGSTERPRPTQPRPRRAAHPVHRPRARLSSHQHHRTLRPFLNQAVCCMGS